MRGLRIVVIGALLALAGCAGKMQEPPATIRIGVPVPVPCRTKSVAVPAFAAEGLKQSDSLEVKVRTLLAERRQRMGYEVELLAAVAACQ